MGVRLYIEDENGNEIACCGKMLGYEGEVGVPLENLESHSYLEKHARIVKDDNEWDCGFCYYMTKEDTINFLRLYEEDGNKYFYGKSIWSECRFDSAPHILAVKKSNSKEFRLLWG